MDHILEYLEQTASKYPDKIAVDDGTDTLTYTQLVEEARQVGSFLADKITMGSPVPILAPKTVWTLAAMFGAVYAGGFYVAVSPDQPADRLAKIFDTLDANLILTKDTFMDSVKNAGFKGQILDMESIKTKIDQERLDAIRAKSSGSDLLYGIFTSGSTGNPKGVVVSHKAVVDFIGHFTEIFEINDQDIIANQAPFDFDVSVKDIYSAIFTGSKLVLIPKELFSTLPRLLDFLCDKEVTNLTWAVSALTLVTTLRGLEYKVPDKVKRVMFSGEVMPIKQLRRWQEALPDAKFVNLYGPSEITCNCTYYEIDRIFEDHEKLPLGKVFPGRQVILVDDEICVMGESLASGYYHNPEETAKHFVMYRTDDGTEHPMYKTGDLGYYGEDGELYFNGRRDFQIKHMGHRIELEEIERVFNAVEDVAKSCCIFDTGKNRIVGFYMGEAKTADIRTAMKAKLPVYMVPAKFKQVEQFPLTKNGKTDRKALMELL